MVATAQRPPRALKPTTHAFDALTGILHIATEKGDETGYYLDAVRGEQGTAIGLVLTKVIDRTTYTVAIDAGAVCSCPGFRYRGQCRHSRAVTALIEEGTV